MTRLMILFAILLVSPAKAFDPLIPVPIVEGAWVSDGRPNNGWFLDVDENGYAFVAWYTYEASGRASWLVLQGQLTVYTEAQRRQLGAVAVLRSPLFTGSGGGCPTCPPTPATITQVAELGEGEMTFFDSRRGRITYANQVVPLHAFVLTRQDVDVLAGTWAVVFRDEKAGQTDATETFQTVLRVAKRAPVALHIDPGISGNLDLTPVPAITAQYYAVSCLEGCTGSNLRPVGTTITDVSTWVWWLENGVYRGANTQAVNPNLFPSGTQLYAGSRIHEGFVGQDRVVWRMKSALRDPAARTTSEMVMTRLPDMWATRP
ncbi:MAG: hypothetical protein ACT4QE_02485 [Anaerolineales bacterium]